EAHTLVAYWKQKGYNAYLVSADIPNKGRWYRVRLGGFDNKDDAEAYLHDLQFKENVEAFVSVNE
ncbi:MAG: SPOR domain-containing protein, partial [bacterium]|nr:SPOR domain-containing protein [bacterium]